MRGLPLREHLRQAEHGWDTIDRLLPRAGTSDYTFLRDEMRRDANRFFWLYPVVEGQRGIPG